MVVQVDAPIKRPNAGVARIPWRTALDVLAYLVLADGQSLSAKSLVVRLWPNEHYWDQRSHLRSCIIRLRRAGCHLQATGGRPCPRNLPTGYRLLEVPPDEILVDLLGTVDSIKRRYHRPRPGAIEYWLAPYYEPLEACYE